MPLPRLFVSHDADYGWLICLEYGLVDDGQPVERWRIVTPWFGYCVDPDGRTLGFKVPTIADVDLDAPEAAELWAGPRFDAPVLGLTDASAAEIVLAALTHFGGRNSLNRQLFDIAVAEHGEGAIPAWRACLESGDPMAHFGLGCALHDHGDTHGAYRHLRHYAHLAPAHPWNWCWYGQAAEALGERTEARDAYLKAIELDDEDEPETDAAERLATLG